VFAFRSRRAATAWSWRRSVVSGLMVLVFAGAIAPAAGAVPAPATANDPSAAVDAVGIAAAAPETSGAAAWFVRLQNQNSGMCLVARGGADGAPVVQTPCSYYRDQYWELMYAGTSEERDFYQLRNDNSGMCMVVRGSAEGARAVQTRCAYFADQYWYIGSPGTTNPFHIQNVHSFRCLVVRGGADGAPAAQTGCGSWSDQIWYYW
jgi:hypothetical protein